MCRDTVWFLCDRSSAFALMRALVILRRVRNWLSIIIIFKITVIKYYNTIYSLALDKTECSSTLLESVDEVFLLLRRVLTLESVWANRITFTGGIWPSVSNMSTITSHHHITADVNTNTSNFALIVRFISDQARSQRLSK